MDSEAADSGDVFWMVDGHQHCQSRAAQLEKPPLLTSKHFPRLPQPTPEGLVTFILESLDPFAEQQNRQWQHRHAGPSLPPPPPNPASDRLGLQNFLDDAAQHALVQPRVLQQAQCLKIQLVQLSRIPSIYKCRTLPAKLQSHRGQHLARLSKQKDFFMPPTSETQSLTAASSHELGDLAAAREGLKWSESRKHSRNRYVAC